MLAAAHPGLSPAGALASRCSSSLAGQARLAQLAAPRLQRLQQPRRQQQQQVVAFKIEKQSWWEKETAPNLIIIDGAKDFAEQLSAAGDQLVVVDFFAKWCVACRAMFPELVKLARKNPDCIFLCVEYDVNKDLCKALEVKQIPYFQLYREKGRVAAFTCGVSKLFILKDAIMKFRPLPAL